ncbi:MAG: hypothetical protein QME96_12125 [Myxococcota bacterium]|nr:hypothetical protein [Myxococcota bacterium]
MIRPGQRLLTAAETAEYFGYTRTTFAHMRKAGQFPGFPESFVIAEGSRPKWDRLEIDAWIAQRQAASRGPTLEEVRAHLFGRARA